ncbi:MAG TPA: hypothetical protein VIZ62_06910 [Nitrososphaeraceae archaeon]
MIEIEKTSSIPSKIPMTGCWIHYNAHLSAVYRLNLITLGVISYII